MSMEQVKVERGAVPFEKRAQEAADNLKRMEAKIRRFAKRQELRSATTAGQWCKSSLCLREASNRPADDRFVAQGESWLAADEDWDG